MPLFWISLAFLSGIVLSRELQFPLLIWGVISLTAIILLFPPIFRLITSRFPSRFRQINTSLKISTAALYPLMILFFSLGAVRYQLSQPVINSSFIAFYNDQSIEYVIDAVIIDPPDVRESYTNLRLNVKQIRTTETAQFILIHGSLLARVPRDTSYVYGDLIRLQGHLTTPTENEDFSYRDYLANQGIYSTISYPITSLLLHGQGSPIFSALYTFRQQAVNLVYHLFPDPESSLVAGILLGVQSGIPQDVQESFRLTGTSHIIVISGYNISIIAVFFTFVFSQLLGERRGAIISAIGIIFYTMIVGANPAVVRAAVLGILTIFGHQVGRRQVGLNSLAFVAAGMAIFSPSIMWDVSFQLSFAATLGIMLYAQPFTLWFTSFVARFIPVDSANRLAVPVGNYILLTLAAQLTTLPLMVYYFKRISLTSLIANPLILPVQPPLMVLGGLAILAGIIIQPIGQLFAWAAWPFCTYTIRVVEWVAAIPHGSIPLGQTVISVVILFYIVLFTITFAHDYLKNLATRLTPAIPLTLAAALTIMIWKAAFYAPDGLMHITILDVGTGEAVLIQSPSGRNALINGGLSTVRLSDALGRRIPPFNRSLDWLLVADIDNEDISGIQSNLERFTPNNVLWAGNSNASRTSMDLWSQLIKLSIPITLMQSDQALDLGSGAILRVLSVDTRGAVLFLEWNHFRFLLPMGMDFAALENLQQNSAMRNLSALLLAESGYAPLNPPELIAFLHPQLALLSVAPADKTGLPSPATLQALQGYNLLRTDLNGWIELTTDGIQMWVSVEKK